MPYHPSALGYPEKYISAFIPSFFYGHLYHYHYFHLVFNLYTIMSKWSRMRMHHENYVQENLSAATTGTIILWFRNIHKGKKNQFFLLQLIRKHAK